MNNCPAKPKVGSCRYLVVVIAIVCSLLGMSTKAEVLNTGLAELDGQAKFLAGALGAQLKGELLEAINSNGLVTAIDVCAEQAPAIAQKLSIENGATVGRVSSQPRNSNNGLLDWQQRWLQSFSVRQSENEPVQQLERSEISEAAGEYRFMKAIATGPLCLACHGKNIQPSVRSAIRARYPEDKAYGYELGELRGAFVVTFPLENLSQVTPKNTSNTEPVK